MAKYTYASKNEYQSLKGELEKVIKRVQRFIKKIESREKKFTFQFKLVGTNKHYLITKESVNNNLDFDYNLILNFPDNQINDADFVVNILTEAFMEAVKDTIFSKPECYKTSISLKSKVTKKNKSIHCCDFSIIYYPEINCNYFKYILNGKKTSRWETRESSRGVEEKIKWLQENVDDCWNIIRHQFLKAKNENIDRDRHSFQLFHETVNNLYKSINKNN